MKLPLIAYDSGDILIFKSIAVAIRYIEPVDIHEYEYYDSDGYSVNAILGQDNKVQFVLHDPPLLKMGLLSSRLNGFLKRCGISSEGENLGELIEQAAGIALIE